MLIILGVYWYIFKLFKARAIKNKRGTHTHTHEERKRGRERERETALTAVPRRRD